MDDTPMTPSLDFDKRDAIEASLESASPPMSPRYRLGWEDAVGRAGLAFQVGVGQTPLNPLAAESPCGFVEGLWKHDVGELFLVHASSPDRYLEVNLGPGAAWWSCVFKSYREPLSDPAVPPFSPENLASDTSSDGWEAGLTIPEPFLKEALGLDRGHSLRGNICFILGPGGHRHHFSRAPLPEGPPNFHRVSDFGDLCYLVAWRSTSRSPFDPPRSLLVGTSQGDTDWPCSPIRVH